MTQRNLICHVYPRSIGGHWRQTVQHLRARWESFNGLKLVSVVVDSTTDTAADVAHEFGDSSVEITERENSCLQEVESLFPLLARVVQSPGITLYCHAKGATHCPADAASHAWRDAMASACLDYPDLVDCMLADGATCGAFRSIQPIGNSPAPWHFAGTWWWVRNDALASRQWDAFDRAFWGVESYPGRQFSHHDGRCLFFDHAETAHLYHSDFWRSHIGPSFRAWRRRLNQCGLRPLCDRPPLSVLGREVLA